MLYFLFSGTFNTTLCMKDFILYLRKVYAINRTNCIIAITVQHYRQSRKYLSAHRVQVQVGDRVKRRGRQRKRIFLVKFFSIRPITLTLTTIVYRVISSYGLASPRIASHRCYTPVQECCYIQGQSKGLGPIHSYLLRRRTLYQQSSGEIRGLYPFHVRLKIEGQNRGGEGMNPLTTNRPESCKAGG